MPIELTEVIAKAIELASPLIEQHQHDLSVEVGRHGLSVMADPGRLAQVVNNLLTNVGVRSEGSGRGSEFVVRLPRIDVVPAATETETAREVRATSSGLRVLVVDDNEDAAEMLAEALSQAGQHTVTALDGPAALTAAAELRPHVALLDLGLPVMDGFELARQFRSEPSLQDTRLVAVTGYGQEHDRQRSGAAGFDAHVVKPVDRERISDLVRQLADRADPGRGVADPESLR